MRTDYERLYLVSSKEDRIKVKEILQNLGYKWMEGENMFEFDEPDTTTAFGIYEKSIIYSERHNLRDIYPNEIFVDWKNNKNLFND
jgi:hypothetical protein